MCDINSDGHDNMYGGKIPIKSWACAFVVSFVTIFFI